MPDDELFAAAQAGTLHEPDGPAGPTHADARRREDRPIHRVVPAAVAAIAPGRACSRPTPVFIPITTSGSNAAWCWRRRNTSTRCSSENLSLREFLASDWTMLNPRLAMHYGLPPLKESGFQKVKLRPEDHRGGLLTQASILSLTSDGTRHRPVHRGVWVSEAIFGRTPPPPPPNVEPLEPTPSNKPKATIRMQLEAHATHATCASCHAKIDPLGFGFDNFDAIGRWRTEEQVIGGQRSEPGGERDRETARRPRVPGTGRVQTTAGARPGPFRGGVRRAVGDVRAAPRDDHRRRRRRSRRSPPRARRTATSSARSSRTSSPRTSS